MMMKYLTAHRWTAMQTPTVLPMRKWLGQLRWWPDHGKGSGFHFQAACDANLQRRDDHIEVEVEHCYS